MAVTMLSTLSLRDDKGQVAKMRWYSTAATAGDAATSALAVEAAIVAITNCTVVSFTGPAGLDPQPIVYGTSAQYKNCEDKAQLLFQTAVGALHKFQIPAPKVAIFLTDQETVDPGNGLVVTLVAAMTDGVTCDRSSSPLSSLIGGGYIRRKTERKFNTITKNPALAGPGL